MQTVSIDEYRKFGRNMRMTTKRDPATVGTSWVELPGTTQWHDFDGDEAYADSGVSVSGGGPPTRTPLIAQAPGTGV